MPRHGRVVQHVPFVELVFHSRRLVHVEDDLHAALHRLRQHKGVEVVKPRVKPAVVFAKVGRHLLRIPVAPHLIADQRSAPRLERIEVVIGHVLRRRHHAAQPFP